MNKDALAIVAHPDDAEFLTAGALALLREKGWRINIATMTAGDCGSTDLSKEEISAIRRKEAEKATALLDGRYYCLESEDMFILYDRPTLLGVIALIRRVNPKLVLTMSPDCYLVDHEITSQLVRTACFSAGIKNIHTKELAPIDHIPTLYYMDALEGKDKFGKAITPAMVVDISSVIDTKEQMLSCHESQRSWLLAHHGMDEYLMAMKQYSSKQGALIGTAYGEGFRQHLGHAFPQENLLRSELGGLVYKVD